MLLILVIGVFLCWLYDKIMLRKEQKSAKLAQLEAEYIKSALESRDQSPLIKCEADYYDSEICEEDRVAYNESF